jgi:hypothetical protein
MDIDDAYEDVCNVDEECMEETTTVKIVHSHSKFTEHPYDLGLIHCAPQEYITKLVFEEYEKGLVQLDR